MTGESIIVALIMATTPFVAVVLNERNRRRERAAEKIERDRLDAIASATATARNDQTQEKLEVIRTEVNGTLLTKIDALRVKTVEEVREVATAKMDEFRAEMAAERAAKRRSGERRLK